MSKDNSGALFRNDRATRDTHPTHTGIITIAGKEYWLSAWVNEGQKGKYFSLSVKPKENQQQAREFADRAHSGPAAHNDFDDPEIPF